MDPPGLWRSLNHGSGHSLGQTVEESKTDAGREP
jgi:hypothetical protein